MRVRHGGYSDTQRQLSIEPALTAALLRDIEEGGAKDCLPLLAFTLERLYVEYGGGRRLTIADYEGFGRIKGSIEAAVESALEAADGDLMVPKDRDARLVLLRRGLIPWLAGIDPETGDPRRRVARASEIPAEALTLIDKLVEVRLLSADRVVRHDDLTGARIVERTIEPAHDILLRQWGLLKGWLSEDLAALTVLESVKRAASEWAANQMNKVWLAHRGGRLEDAEREADPKFRTIDARDRAYLTACHAEGVAEESQRRRSGQIITYGALSFCLILSVVAYFLFVSQKHAQRQTSIALQQREEAQKQRDQALQAQANYRVEQSQAELKAGRRVEALLLAMAGLPAEPTTKAEAVAASILKLVRDAVDDAATSLQS